MKKKYIVRKRCPRCHGLGVVMGKDGETKPCWNPACKDGWVEE
jgi:hypothetical protein